MTFQTNGAAMRTKYGVLLVLTLMSAAVWPAQAARRKVPRVPSLVQFALADVHRKSRDPRYREAISQARYITVTVGNRVRTYRRNGQLVKVAAARYPSAGLMGRYAEVGWDLLDANRKGYSDTFGYYVVRLVSGRWRVIAQGGSRAGYADDSGINRVPLRVRKRLKLG